MGNISAGRGKLALSSRAGPLKVLQKAAPSDDVQPLPSVGIGTPNIRVDCFLRFAVRFRLVFFAFRFLAM